MQVNIFAISGSLSPSDGETVITPAQAADLLNELWYINLHTTLFPAGEVRGQVIVDAVVPAEEPSVSQLKASFQ